MRDEDSKQHACDVRVENRGALPKRKAADGAGGVGADALEREQRRFILRQLSAVLRDRFARDRLQAPGADVVAERIPRRRHFVFRRVREHFHRRILVEPFGVLRQDAIDLRLLQHDFRDEDVIRVGGLAPRQIAAVAAIPRQQPLTEAAAIGGGRQRQRRVACVLTGHALAASRIIRPVKIYTRTGDTGETSLFGGDRVRKDDPRVDAYGEVDELNAWLGLARAASTDASLDAELVQLQRDLFALGAQLADPADKLAPRVTKAVIGDADVLRLEQLIDRLEAELPPLRRFILAGGASSRRGASRRAHRLPPCRAPDGRPAPPVDPVLLRYVNRLSDLLFVMARVANHRAGAAETEW